MVSHKKKLRSEKAKVKLKSTKLPKGLNVTKTEFKVRKITIREQLKEPQYADGQRQLNLKETISRLKHHSSKLRSEALRSLREAISTKRVNLTGYMISLVQSICAISLDIDRETRRDSFKALNCLLSTLTTEEVVPLFNIISSYLRCAMTHIQPAIQEDSLLMLDVLLQHVPDLVATHSTKIMQHFLEMISRARKEGDHTSRTLTIRLNQKDTNVRWRTKVLERLEQMLAALVKHKQHSGLGNCGNSFTRIITFNPNIPQYYDLKRPFLRLPNIDVLSHFRPSLGNNNADAMNINSKERLQAYIKHLLPLLVESWVEVRPTQQKTTTTLTNEAAHILKTVLGIMQNLWLLVELHEKVENNHQLSEWFQREYAEMFANHFLTKDFPYQQVVESPQLKKSKRLNTNHIKTLSSNGGQLCLEQNICLAYLMCQFYKSPNTLNQQAEKFVSLLQFLDNIVTHLTIYKLQDFRTLTMALCICLMQNGLQFIHLNKNIIQSLLNGTVTAFLQNRFPSRDDTMTEVLTLLCDIVQSPDLRHNFGENEFVRFLEYLPQLLLKQTINVSTLIAMSVLGKQKNEIFLHALEEKIELIIENIQKIQVVGAPNAFEGKKHIINLFYWTEKKFTLEYRELLLQNIDKYITDKRIVNYYKYVLSCLSL